MSGRTAGASGEISFTAELSDNKNAATKVAALGDFMKNYGSIINVGVARPKGRATPNIFCYYQKRGEHRRKIL